MEGLALVSVMVIIIGIMLVGAGAGILYIHTVTAAFEDHWLFGGVVAIVLFVVYVLLASFLVGMFLV